MDDYAVYLAEEANSDVAALHQFRILYDERRKSYHMFFEGEEDSLFYMPEVRRYLMETSAHIYVCGGKANVIYVRDAIAAEYDTSWVSFFIDRDYDDLLGSQPIIDNITYITDNYSIENDIASVDAARILIEDVVRISRADPEFDRIMAEMAAGSARFYREIRTLMAWIIAAKADGCSPNLNNTVGLKGILEGKGLACALTKRGFEEFKKRVAVKGLVPAVTSILRWARSLDLNSPKSWVRGKYDIWFFQVSLLAALEETNVRRKAAGGRALRIPSALREGRVFELLGGRVPPPASLTDFLRSRLN